MISEKQKQIRQVTKNGQEEIEATFKEALQGKITKDEAKKSIIRRLSGPIKMVRLTVPVEAKNKLFDFYSKASISSNEIQDKLKIEKENGNITHIITDSVLSDKIFDYYFKAPRQEKDFLESSLGLWIIRDPIKASIKIEDEGYLFLVNTIDPPWLIAKTSYPEDYTEEKISDRIKNNYRGVLSSKQAELYAAAYGKNASEQLAYINEYMTRKNKIPNPVYIISHPLLGFRNADNIVTADGKMIGRDITVRRNGDYEYMWKNKGENAARKKIAHFRMFQINDLKGNPIPGYRWVITAGAYEKEAYASIANLQFNLYWISFVIATLFIIGIYFAIRFTLLRPLSELVSAVEQVDKGSLDVEVPVRHLNEIGYLSHSFNNMLKSIRHSHKELAMTNDAYSKFVPREFLKHLDKESILDVRLGDQCLRDMTVLFSDIRSFTTLSENMTPKDTFDFLNSYLEKIGPLIRDNGGFIDKYIGDAIMAIFPDGPDSAVRAAISIQKTLEEYNLKRAEWNKPPVKVGIGIHTGSLMLGVIGENLRLDSTVIADAVNVASRLEELTKKLGSGILISSTVQDLIGTDNNFHARRLGKFNIKGKKEPVEVYEIFNHETSDLIQLKEKYKDKFQKGIELLAKNLFETAAVVFNEISELNPGDVQAKLYLNRCKIHT